MSEVRTVRSPFRLRYPIASPYGDGRLLTSKVAKTVAKVPTCRGQVIHCQLRAVFIRQNWRTGQFTSGTREMWGQNCQTYIKTIIYCT